jgi:hypothetical protein
MSWRPTVARVRVRHVVGAGCLVCGAQEPARARQVLKLLADGKSRSALWLREALGLDGYGSVSRALSWLVVNGHVEKVLDNGRYRYQRTAR